MDVVKLTKTEKMGTSEWLTVRSHARQKYLALDADLVSVFQLRTGDRVKVKFVELQRADEGGSEIE